MKKDNNLSVELPIDNFKKLWPGEFKKARVGLVAHPASISKNLIHTLDILKQFHGSLLEITCIFGPQHGFLGQTQDNMIEWEGFGHAELRIPVYSLYGSVREPSEEMLAGLDVLIIDLQDVGARYYTFIWTMFLCMRACERFKKPVVVLDRPNPINARTIEGELPDPEYASFVGLYPIPVRHGKTIGQLAGWFQSEVFRECDLTVLPMDGWEPWMWYDNTGLPWVSPSPNMPTLDTAIVYPGMCLLEGTNISEARGTTKPFELFGASFINGPDLSRKLNDLRLPGVFFRTAYFEPAFHKFKGELCQGAQIHVTDRDEFLSYKTGVEIIKAIRNDYPEYFKWKEPPYEYEYHKLPIEILIGGPVSDTFPD